tara:strand:- start:103 stop:573 length:471 start_codon:yes stop_codon:yes gene_type:complete
MKKLTIIPDDNMVVVDGEGFSIDVNIESSIHAIQWDEVKGEGQIEYNDGKDNKAIKADGIAEYLSFATSHEEEKAKRTIALAKAEETAIKEKAEKDEFDAKPTSKRAVAFNAELPVGDQLDEILKFIDSQPVKSVNMQAVIDKANDIKDRFPKEDS